MGGGRAGVPAVRQVGERTYGRTNKQTIYVEAQIHKKALVLFNNVCHQNKNAVERRLAERQLTVKTGKSNSWFIEVRRLFWWYELGEAEDLLKTPVKKEQWKRSVSKSVSLWKTTPTTSTTLKLILRCKQTVSEAEIHEWHLHTPK
ncbi:hypothetical protein DPMN_155531 [Dreissena polymorpha]|uniref:Uncharacterized protein n=1 Tax=Dreissena polymorpha TaxID=45954 RepID=A0A9D4FQI8_DREPO|nr:hypothetical protein DPMN_155531 [Dreissena polymorpha]